MRRARVVLALGLALLAGAAAAAAPAGAATATFTVRYLETFGGTQKGDAFLAVVGHGSMSATGGGGGPIAAVARGGTYVTRYDIDAQGVYRGLFVVTFKQRSLGTMCFAATIVVGKFVLGKSFPPSSASFRSVGGTGGSAKLRVSGTLAVTGIVGGSDDETITAKGALVVSSGPAKPPTAACLAVAKLAR